jgi:selenide, water dikinase
VLRSLTPSEHPDLLVGTGTGDDAAVWRLDAARALVATADFITPVVDDPRTWGRIAAANAVSDVYAMGGRPLFALSLLAWPSSELPLSMLTEVLDGGAQTGAECGFLVVGGHSVDDPEPKYGLAVIGEVHPDRILTNSDLRPSQSLVLTKALGTGIVATAIKRGEAPSDIVSAAVESMTMPNALAGAAALAAGATAATDITGFGLLGHLGRMASASNVDLSIELAAVPLLPGVRELAEAGAIPGGSRRNRDWIAPWLRVDPAVTELDVLLLADAQTSGGLVFGAHPTAAAEAVATLRAQDVPAAVIGTTHPGSGRLHVR